MPIDSSDKRLSLVGASDAAEEVSKVELMILGLLQKRATYGYEIVEELSNSAMGPWVKLGRTSVYSALGRLARKSLVSKHGERHGGRPERAVYSITDAGRRVFIAGLGEALGQPDESMGAFDVALFFSNYLEDQQVRDALAQRRMALERMLELTKEALGLARAPEDHGLILVLQHRERLLSMQIRYAEELADQLAAAIGRQAPMVSGTLKDTLVQDVLRGLASASRTGVLTISGGRGSIAFVLESGQVTGVGGAEQSELSEWLRRAFSDDDGVYEFTQHAAIPEPYVPVTGLAAVILQGTRDVASWDVLKRVVPDRGTLLDLVEGHRYEMIGLDLAPDERALLSALDGVRTAGEVSRDLKWSLQRLASQAYPLWAAGWVRRTDSHKRQMVLALLKYLDHWAEIVQVMAGDEGVAKVFGDLQLAARAANLPDFLAARSDLASVRFGLDVSGLTDTGREYALLVRRAAAARLGHRFVEEAAHGKTKHLGEQELLLLKAFGID